MLMLNRVCYRYIWLYYSWFYVFICTVLSCVETCYSIILVIVAVCQVSIMKINVSLLLITRLLSLSVISMTLDIRLYAVITYTECLHFYICSVNIYFLLVLYLCMSLNLFSLYTELACG